MKPPTEATREALTPLVEVRPEPDGQYTAQVVGIPEIRLTAATREEALGQVREVLSAWLASGRLVAVEVPQTNPLLQWFGHAKEDPDFDLYLEEMRRFREEVDAREGPQGDEQACSDSSSTPTT